MYQVVYVLKLLTTKLAVSLLLVIWRIVMMRKVMMALMMIQRKMTRRNLFNLRTRIAQTLSFTVMTPSAMITFPLETILKILFVDFCVSITFFVPFILNESPKFLSLYIFKINLTFDNPTF